MDTPKFEIREVDPRTLNPWERNPRNHNMPALKASIEKFGFRNIVVVNKNNNVIEAGHGRVQAAIELNIGTVPVLFVDDDETTAAAYTVADNRQSDLGGWNETELLPLLQELSNSSMDIWEGIGFDDAAIQDLLQRVAPSESTISGRTMDEALTIYNEGTVKQITLYYNTEEYTDLLMRMKVIMDRLAISTNSELLAALVTYYESNNQ